MLIGQEIGLGESLWISLIGMGVVMLELLLLSLFVLVLAKFTKTVKVAKKAAKETEVPASSSLPRQDVPSSQPVPLTVTGASSESIEMAAALAASFAEIGVIPNGNETVVISAKHHTS